VKTVGAPRHLWRWVLVGAAVTAIVLVACAGLAYLGLRWSVEGMFAQEELSPAAVERFARIKLPPSASELQTRVVGFQDHQVHIRFRMAAADLPAFLAGSACPGPLVADEMPGVMRLSIDRPWWTPERAQRFASCRVIAPSFTEAILVDMTVPEIYTVYIVMTDF
jgi:hypothetical protein